MTDPNGTIFPNNIRDTSNCQANLYQLPDPQDDLPPWFTICCIIIGTVGNLLVCLAIILDRKLQNLTNYFLLSLAITDLLVSVLILPGRLLTVTNKFQPELFPLCFLYLIGDDYVTAASSIHICFISFERYMAIKNPFNVITLTKSRVAKKIGLVWVIAFLTVIPYMVSAIITDHPTYEMHCAYLLSNFKFFDAILFIESAVILVMVVVVIVCFTLTTIQLNRLMEKQRANVKRSSEGESGLVRNVGRGNSKEDDESSTKKKDSQAVLREQKALRVVWLVSFAFMICMVPYMCPTFSYLIAPEVVIPPLLIDITAYFAYANSVINPIIYTIFNREFRNDFKNIILFRFKELQRRPNRLTTAASVSTVSI